MIVGGYSLHLYCDWAAEHPYKEFPHEYGGLNATEAFATARREGWKIDKRSGLAICPACHKGGATIGKLKQMRAAQEADDEY